MKISKNRGALAFLFLSILSFSSFAQPMERQLFLGVSAEISKLEPQEAVKPTPNVMVRNEKNYNAKVQAGYFATRRTAIGVHFQFSKYAESYTLTGKPFAESNNGDFFSVGVFGRQYFGTGLPRIFFFAQVTAAYGHGKYSSAQTIPSSNTYIGYPLVTNYFESVEDRLMIDLVPGVTYFISKHFAIAATIGSLGYATSTTVTESNTFNGSYSPAKYTQFNLALNAFSLGFNFYLGGSSAAGEIGL
jgi:hypothetical protein